MKWNKLFKAATESIRKNRMRSLLTMLGIIIGVGAVIVMVAIGQGAQQEIEENIASLGTNVIMVMPNAGRLGGVSQGAGSSNTLRLSDVEDIRAHTTRVPLVSPIVRASAQVVGGRGNWSTTVFGVTEDYLEIRDWRLASGALFTEQDTQMRRKVAVIGTTIADELFPGQEPVGAAVRIGNTPFTVIGVLEAKGQNAMGQDQDDVILAPSTTVLYRLSGGQAISQIYASAATTADMHAAQEEIRQVLRVSHRLQPNQPDDFIVRNQAQITETASATTRTLTLLLGSIAGVSLLVGGIGIMNIMLVSVTERTREIGLRLSVGARSSDVMAQFLVEAIVLSLLGGLLGVLFSVSVTYGLTEFAGLRTAIAPVIVFVALGFSAAVGVFFGYYPARKAATLDPIDALRYE